MKIKKYSYPKKCPVCRSNNSFKKFVSKGIFYLECTIPECGHVIEIEVENPLQIQILNTMELTESSVPPNIQDDTDGVLDKPCIVSVELGKTKHLLRDILNMRVGSPVVLEKLAGDPVDIYANGHLVAVGEVVIVDDRFGVRITEITPK